MKYAATSGKQIGRLVQTMQYHANTWRHTELHPQNSQTEKDKKNEYEN